MSNISAICHSCKSLFAGDRTHILFALVKGNAPLLPLLRASRHARMMLGVQCSKSLYVETCSIGTQEDTYRSSRSYKRHTLMGIRALRVSSIRAPTITAAPAPAPSAACVCNRFLPGFWSYRSRLLWDEPCVPALTAVELCCETETETERKQKDCLRVPWSR